MFICAGQLSSPRTLRVKAVAVGKAPPFPYSPLHGSGMDVYNALGWPYHSGLKNFVLTFVLFYFIFKIHHVFSYCRAGCN